jgi:hypothetical protein
VGKIRNVYRILVKKPNGNHPPGRPKGMFCDMKFG